MSNEQTQEFLEDLLDTSKVEPLSPIELRRIRRMVDEYDKAAWLKKKIMIWTPWVISIVGGLYAVWTVIAAHWQTTPKG